MYSISPPPKVASRHRWSSPGEENWIVPVRGRENIGLALIAWLKIKCSSLENCSVGIHNITLEFVVEFKYLQRVDQEAETSAEKMKPECQKLQFSSDTPNFAAWKSLFNCIASFPPHNSSEWGEFMYNSSIWRIMSRCPDTGSCSWSLSSHLLSHWPAALYFAPLKHLNGLSC